MIRTFSFAAALLIALSSFAFAGTGSPSNGAFPQTHKHPRSKRSLRFWYIREQVRVLMPFGGTP